MTNVEALDPEGGSTWSGGFFFHRVDNGMVWDRRGGETEVEAMGERGGRKVVLTRKIKKEKMKTENEKEYK